MTKSFLFPLMTCVIMISTSVVASHGETNDLTTTKILDLKVEVLDLAFNNGMNVDFTEVSAETELLTSEILDADEALHCKVKQTKPDGSTIKFTCWFCDCAAFAEALK